MYTWRAPVDESRPKFRRLNPIKRRSPRPSRVVKIWTKVTKRVRVCSFQISHGCPPSAWNDTEWVPTPFCHTNYFVVTDSRTFSSVATDFSANLMQTKSLSSAVATTQAISRITLVNQFTSDLLPFRYAVNNIHVDYKTK